jgi:hypothetical protein
MKIAIIGGTGKLGLGFVSRLSTTSHETVVGSRDAAKARQTAGATAGTNVRFLSNQEAAAWSDLAILTIPYSAHRATIEPLKAVMTGKIVNDATVPLDPDNFLRIKTESGRSAAEETETMLDKALVFAAFETLSHRILRHHDEREDVLVAGPSERKNAVLQFVNDLNLRPVDAGPLEMAGFLERMTPLLLSINKQNGIKNAGLKVTGLPV